MAQKAEGPHCGAVEHILVVDDSRLQRRIVSAMLNRWGYRVTEAGTGADALLQCKETCPDLIVSDWMMPGMTGLEFCLQLRARISAGERILQMQRELQDKNALITTTLDELQCLYSALDKDLIEAEKLQQSLIKDRHKSFGPFDLSLMLHSAGHVGGDLVGLFPAGPNHLGIYAIDVSGHGISSALMTARLAGYLSSASVAQNMALRYDDNGRVQVLPPAEVIAKLNTAVLDELKTELYFTLLLADLDLRSGAVRMAQAGHPHPLIQRADGQIEQQGPGGLPVGLVDGATVEGFGTTLAPGDRLLILSDGVTECPSPAGEMLAEDGLAQMVDTLRPKRGADFLNGLMTQLTAFSGSDVFPDDVSGILLEYRGGAAKDPPALDSPG
ncbi:MAG: SpoIIE family protein phosphatase [Paracoccaceae bacterium]